jgi:hypothetical protein
VDYSAHFIFNLFCILLFYINLIFYRINLDLAASRIFIGIAQGRHGSYTDLSTVSVSKIVQPASPLDLRPASQQSMEFPLCNRHCIGMQQAKNAGKSAALAKESALESQHPKSASESVDSLFSEH